MKRFVLLDRDGTINREVNYLSRPEQLELYPSTGVGLRQMQDLGLGLIIVTNQSGVGRGFLGMEQLNAVHAKLELLLAEFGVSLDGIYVCPHRPDENCRCRKPLPGMIQEAATDFGFDPEHTFVIGDKPCDIDLGRSVGATTLLVRTGYGEQHEKSENLEPDFVVDNLMEAANTVRNCLVDVREDTK